MVDWDADGDLDLLIGSFDGTIRVFLNEGTRQQPQFAVANFKVQAGGKDLMVPGGHAAPVVVDWDGDGRWDILCGCAKGSVYWYRNVGTPSAPRFAAPQTLVEEHRGTGYDEFRDIDEEPVPGIRSQIAAVDYDGDGRIDLLLGDFCLTLTPQRGLTAKQRTEMLALVKQREDVTNGLRAKFAALQAEFKRKYPGDANNSKQADAEWTKAYFAMHGSKAYKDLETSRETLEIKLKSFLETPPRQRWVSGPSTCHGYVWLYRRKPFVTGDASNLSASAAQPAATDAIEQPTQREPVVAVVAVHPAQVQPGDLVLLTVNIKIGIGWHINSVADSSELSIPTRFDLKLPEAMTTDGAWDAPKPDIGLVKSGPTYSGAVRFSRPLRVRADAAAGKVEIQCKVTYQACDESRCLPPTKTTLRVPLEIKAPKQASSVRQCQMPLPNGLGPAVLLRHAIRGGRPVCALQETLLSEVRLHDRLAVLQVDAFKRTPECNLISPV